VKPLEEQEPVVVRDDAGASPHLAGPFACFGQRWRISCDDRALTRLVAELYAPMLVAAGSTGPTITYRITVAAGDRPWEVFRDGELLGRGVRPERLLGKLMWAVNRQVIDLSDRNLLLHAAAAADADGRVVLLPAPMESGKTTLVTGLLDRGLQYLTDEAAAVDPDLTVRGFAKPLSIDDGSWSVLAHHVPDLPDAIAGYMDHQWQIPPQRFTTVVPHGTLAMIVLPSYRAGAETTITRLTPVAALDLIRASTFGPQDEPLTAATMTRLAGVVAAVPCYELRTGDLAEACAAVLDRLEATLTPPPPPAGAAGAWPR
jgi:hypothetical protein